MENDMPSDIRDENPRHPEYNDEEIRVTDELDDSTYAENSSYMPEDSHHSAYRASPSGEKMPVPLAGKGPMRRRTKTRRPSVFGLQPPAIISEEVITGMRTSLSINSVLTSHF